MSDPIMVYSSFMRMEIDRLNSIANNASNVSSAGYLQETTQIDPQKFLQLLQGSEMTNAFNTKKSTSLGSLKVTGRSMDIALASDHWFVLERDGQKYLTRNGSFSISSEGALKLGDFSVLGDSGPIGNVSSSFRVYGNGDIFVDEKVVEKLRLVKLVEGSQLHSEGDGIYKLEGNFVEAEDARVLQGALVNSNVNLEQDMTKMIEITRHIESIQRAMSSYDDMLDVGINQLGN